VVPHHTTAHLQFILSNKPVQRFRFQYPIHPEFQPTLKFYGDDDSYGTSTPGYSFTSQNSPVTFYYSFGVTTPKGLTISQYQVVSATLGDLSVADTSASPSAVGQFSTIPVSANALGIARGDSQVISLNVTVSVKYGQKRAVFDNIIIDQKRALLQNADSSADQPIFFTVPSLGSDQGSSAPWLLSNIPMFLVLLCFILLV